MKGSWRLKRRSVSPNAVMHAELGEKTRRKLTFALKGEDVILNNLKCTGDFKILLKYTIYLFYHGFDISLENNRNNSSITRMILKDTLT